jgi:hypothetical protein
VNIMRNIHLRLLSTTILGVLAPMILVLGSHTAQAAVVYCKYIGVPKGCVVRPGVVLVPAPVVAAPVARARVATPVVAPVLTPGLPDLGAPGVGARYGTPANRGGPVNRVGRR